MSSILLSDTLANLEAAKEKAFKAYMDAKERKDDEEKVRRAVRELRIYESKLDPIILYSHHGSEHKISALLELETVRRRRSELEDQVRRKG